MIGRRLFLATLLSLAGSVFRFPKNRPQQPVFQQALPLTKGPNFHWFGYYDKLQTDPAGRYVLGMQTNVQGRTPSPDDILQIGYIDTEDGNRWQQIGLCRSWGWQQGCMLQWIPGSQSEVIWNDRVDGRLVAHIFDIHSQKKRTLLSPIYALAPDGKTAITTNFSRLQDMRPGYGYPGAADVHKGIKAPLEDGLYKIDLETGASTMLMSYAQASQVPHHGENLDDYWHWFNHLLVNPSGTRAAFLHRWRSGGQDPAYRAVRGFVTRMITINLDGSEPFVIDPSGHTSHFVWRDDNHITAWTKPENAAFGFYDLEDRTSNFSPVGADVMNLNGHNTYVPGTNNEWILNDTYPQGTDRMQEMYLFHIPTKKKVVLGRFYSPPEYTGEWRCDLHQKCDPKGTKVIFDSTHEGKGRQIYCINIESVIKRK